MRKLMVSTVAVGILAAAAGIAYATIPDENGVIHGCRAKATGLLRVIDSASQSCKPWEAALDWNQQGPQGEKGDPGPQGEKGDPGGSFDVYFNRDTDVLPAGAVRGYGIGCGEDDIPIGGGYSSDSTEVTAFRSDVNLVNPGYVLGLNNRGTVAATIQFTSYCLDMTP